MKMKKFLLILLTLTLVVGLVACGGNEAPKENGGNNEKETETEVTEPVGGGEINVISREDGSGTRGAFTEITGVLEKVDGEEMDKTYEGAVIQNSTNGVTTTVKGDPQAIGYISLGSLTDEVKALKVDGVEATPEKVKDGEYPLSRPFLLVYSGELSDLAQDFLDFVQSDEGQAIVEDMGYISVGSKGAYNVTKQEGRIAISGSTSVNPVMEKLAEAYEAHYDNVTVEIQANGSSAGIKAAQEGVSDIGMSSRELKDEETGLTEVVLAQDGIAVIVNLENPLEGLTMEEVRQIFVGEKRSF